MTLVLNRLLPLSGNSLIALAICFALSSCDLLSGAVKQPSGEPDVVYENPEVVYEDDHIPPGKKVVEIAEPDARGESLVLFHDTIYRVAQHKEEFQIALILPFFYNPRTDFEWATSNVMLEYYQGLEMALNDLEVQGLKLKLRVYDNRNDTNVLKRILAKKELEEMDMIIGPVAEEQVQMVSRYSLSKGIPVFSPFTGVSVLSENNPILYSSIPGYPLRARLMVDFLEVHHPNDKLIILSDESNLDKNFVPYLIEELNHRKTISFTRETFGRYTNWSSILSNDSANVVYIPSYNRSVVNTSIGAIFATKKDVTVIGESGWADFEDNDYNFWTRTHVHLMAYDYIDQEDTAVQRFKLRFREINFEDPSTYAFMGYDQMTFIGDFLMAFGEHFPLYISEREFKYLSARYRFIYEFGCNENATIYFLKYEDNRLLPVN